MPTLQERLRDPDERFSPAEMHQVFESLAEEYGFHRDPRMQPKEAIAETASLVIPHFEDLGPVIVRPRTVGDFMHGIPSRVDRILSDNYSPSQNSAFNAGCVAIAQTVIVSPPTLIDDILKADAELYIREEDGATYNFFWEFQKEYQAWSDDRAEAIKAKKSGKTPGKKPAS
jgi:hypothetical protein